MSGAHNRNWWGAFDPHTFLCWVSVDQVYELPSERVFEATRLFLLTLINEPRELHRDFLDELESDQDRATALLLFTAYAHEWRHWYDMTSTPYGLYRTTQLASFYATITQDTNTISRRKQVFAPLLRWVRNEALISTVHPDLDPLVPEETALIIGAHRTLEKADYSMIETTEVNDHAINTSMILEGLAYLEQLDYAEEYFGTDLAHLLEDKLKTDMDEAYLRCIRLLEPVVGQERAKQKHILEAALFGDFAIHGSRAGFYPPTLLKALLPGLTPEMSLEHIRRKTAGRIAVVNGRGPEEVHTSSYVAATRHLDRVMDQLEGDEAPPLGWTLAFALRSAFNLASFARFPELAAQSELPDGMEPPGSGPYGFHAPIIVEGSPGLIQPAEASVIPVWTLVGYTVPTHALMQSAFFRDQMQASPEDDTLMRQSIVWSPFPEIQPGERRWPEYLGLLDHFHPLMYWRALIFGKGDMSPYTAMFSIDPLLELHGQTLLP